MKYFGKNRIRQLICLLFLSAFILDSAASAVCAEAAEPCAHQRAEKYIEEGAAASCETDGWHTEIILCPDCGEELSRVTVTDPAFGHSWEETSVTESTGTVPGSVTWTCLLCGESYIEEIPVQEVPPGQEVPPADSTAAGGLFLPADLTYTGSSQMLITPDEGAVLENSLMFALGPDASGIPAEDAWSFDIPEGKDAGIYYVWFMPAGGTQDPGEAAVCAEVCISPRSITVRAKDQTAGADGQISSDADQAELTEGSLADGDSLISLVLTENDAEAGAAYGVITPSGARIANAAGEDVTDNYLISYQDGRLAKNKMVLSAVRLETPVLVYDGTAQTAAVVKAEAVTEDGTWEIPEEACTVVGNTHMNAGVYTMAVTAKEDSGFTGTVFAAFRIIPKSAVTLRASVNPGSATFNGTEKEPAVNVKDGQKLLIRNRDYTFTYTDNVHAGRAKAVITFRGNYSGIKNVFFVIKKASLEIEDEPAPRSGLVYTGIRQELLEEPESLPEGCLGIEYSTDEGAVWSDKVPRAKDPGRYVIWYRFIGDDDHLNTDARPLISVIASRRRYETAGAGIRDD